MLGGGVGWYGIVQSVDIAWKETRDVNSQDQGGICWNQTGEAAVRKFELVYAGTGCIHARSPSVKAEELHNLT